MDAITLREYQVLSIREVFDLWRRGARSVVLVAPTGSGKRVIALWLLEYAAQAGRRVLFVGNRRLLITQAQADAEKYGLDHGVIMADNESGNPASTNQLASIQTLESWYFYEKYSSELTGTGLPPADLLVIDECHQEPKRYRQLLQLYPHAKVLALTATPVGPSGRSLVPGLYDVLAEPIKNSQLIQLFRETGQGLLPTRVYAPSEPNIEGVKIVKGEEYNQRRLGRAVQSCTVFADVFREWEAHQDRATVCFVPGVPFGRHLVDQFNHRLGPQTAELIEAKTKPGERKRIFQEVEDGSKRIIVSVDVLREGFDLPLLSCGIDLQPNSQLRSYWQKIGRIKRPHGAQVEAIWLDLAGNYWKFLHPDQDPQWPQGDQTTQEAIQESRQSQKTSQPIACPKCSFVRERGPCCPQCGYQAPEAIRRIRMGNGVLREVPAIAKQRRELTTEERLFNKWKGRLFAAMHTGHTYSQAAHLYCQDTGEYPKVGWPGVFPAHALEWRGKPKLEFTPATLMRACQTYLRREP